MGLPHGGHHYSEARVLHRQVTSPCSHDTSLIELLAVALTITTTRQTSMARTKLTSQSCWPLQSVQRLKGSHILIFCLTRGGTTKELLVVYPTGQRGKMPSLVASNPFRRVQGGPLWVTTGIGTMIQYMPNRMAGNITLSLNDRIRLQSQPTNGFGTI